MSFSDFELPLFGKLLRPIFGDVEVFDDAIAMWAAPLRPVTMRLRKAEGDDEGEQGRGRDYFSFIVSSKPAGYHRDALSTTEIIEVDREKPDSCRTLSCPT